VRRRREPWLESAFEWRVGCGRVAADFTCLLTRDQLFGESAARALKTLPSFAVVVVGLPQQRWQAHQEQFVAAWRARSIEPVAGTLVHWPQK